MDRILDFSKKKELVFAFINANGEKCEFTNVISAKMIDEIEEFQDDLNKEMISTVKNKVKIKGEKDIDFSEALASIDVDIEAKVKDKFVELFLGDQIDRFNEQTEGISRSVKNALFKIIDKEISELNEMLGDDEKK